MSIDWENAVMYGNSIRKDNGDNSNGYTYYPVVVIGAGESGIAMGCQLKEQIGFDQFRIFERQSGIGGTWWINRYPGVACDVPAVFYSFSFCQNPSWTTFHPTGPEIVRYLQDVCGKYEMVDKIQLNTDVKECKWNPAEGVWELTLQHLTVGAGDLSEFDRKAKAKKEGHNAVYLREENVRCKVLTSAVGGLVEPKQWPENIPGHKNFLGDIFHSARWRYDLDLTGKDVIVLGTGCSAAQFVPRLTKEYGVKSVTQIMRSPPWVVPRANPPGGKEWWEKWSPWLNRNVPGFQRSIRALLAAGIEYDWRLFGATEFNEKERGKLEKNLLEHMKSTVPSKYHEILTPDYSVGCKRRIFDASWFPGLNDPHIELTNLSLKEISERSVKLGPSQLQRSSTITESKDTSSEVELPADTIILANGFETTQWLHPLEIIGRDGTKLHDIFDERGGPQMYMGTAMDSFPNFFVIFGPNTATGHSSVILASENMVNMTIKFIKPILRGDIKEVEVKKEAEIAWAQDTQRALKDTVFEQGGCFSWYKTESGWNSTVYPYTQIWFTLRCMFPTWSDWNITYTSKGLRKKRTKAMLRYLAYAAAFVGIYKARQARYGLTDLLAFLKGYLRLALLMVARTLQRVGSKV